jgi:hypothetical protein
MLEPSSRETESRTARVVKKTLTVLWVFCGLIIPCLYPLVPPEPQTWWKTAGWCLFGLAWLVPVCGLYVAILNDDPQAPLRAKLTKTIILGVLLGWWIGPK